MANLTNFTRAALLNHLCGKSAYTMPTIYVACFTTLPSNVGTDGVEVSGGGYARIACPAGSWNSAVGSSGSITTAADIVWGTATTNWGTIVGVALCDALTAGNVLITAPLATTRVINTGDTFKIPAGSLTFTDS